MSVERSQKKYHGFVVSQEVDDRLAAVAKKFRLKPSEILRRSVDYALPAFEKSNRLPALRSVEQKQEK